MPTTAFPNPQLRNVGFKISTHPAGVVSIRMPGLVTPGMLQQAMREVGATRDIQPLCFVADFAGSVVAADGVVLDGLMAAGGAADTSMPGACVVSPPILNLFLDHAQRMAARGVTRRVFVCPESAHLWAQRQAALAGRRP